DQQVRETETWVPSEQKSDDDFEVVSGDSPNSSDFDFMNQDELDTYDDEDDEDGEDYDGSGSGDKGKPTSPPNLFVSPIDDDEVVIENPKDSNDVVSKSQNEVGVRSKVPSDEVNGNVLMASTSNESVFERKEVLAAVIAGGVVFLVFTILLILVVVLLIHRMKKKDEGSYELAKKPIYTKAPTAEIYA
ncbi:SDC4 protein, partial [Polyodon spathula]|nr:SDC4 protein [Polyodon spathula]